MRTSLILTAVAICAPSSLWGASGLAVAEATVGRNLQAPANVVLPMPLPGGDVELQLTSDDPARLLLSAAPDRAGSPSLRLVAKTRSPISPTFYLQGLADRGEVRYTVSAAGMDPVKGVVKLAPSGIAIVGPLRLPSFPTTPHAPLTKLTVASAVLDAEGGIVGEQSVAGGITAVVEIANSDPEAGTVRDPSVKIAGGSSSADTYFAPAGLGQATLTLKQPPGFVTPKTMQQVTAAVERPGLAIADEFTVGKNLQLLGVLCLGEAPPEGGLKVTLTSSDPSKLVLSAKEDEPGSGTLVLNMPKGELTAKYYLQGLGDSGSVTYTATAPGFRRRIGKIDLAPSGFMVAYDRYGPPDRAMVERKDAKEIDERRFFPSIAESKERTLRVAVYSAYIDPRSGMAADITVQPLRAGVSATIDLESSHPEIATVESPVTLTPGTLGVVSKFTPLQPGETVISLKIPPGFVKPKNASFAPATVVP
jgi:hypothetical protein